MSRLITTANIADPDGFYAELLAVHEGRNKQESDALNARLMLILANHIGDRETLSEALETARESSKSLKETETKQKGE